MILLKESYPDSLFGGAYLEQVLSKTPFRYQVNTPNLKTYEKIFLDNTKLSGFTNNDKDVILALDKLYSDDKRMLPLNPFKKDGTLSKYFENKSFNSDQFNELIEYCEKIIIQASEKIKQASFDITPVVRVVSSSKKIYPCEYCKYKSICYVSDENLTYVNKNSDFSYIFKEEKNDEME